MTSVLRRRIARVARRQQELDDEKATERAREEVFALAEHLGLLRPLPDLPEGWECVRAMVANNLRFGQG
jgi:hypothetical protein